MNAISAKALVSFPDPNVDVVRDGAPSAQRFHVVTAHVGIVARGAIIMVISRTTIHALLAMGHGRFSTLARNAEVAGVSGDDEGWYLYVKAKEIRGALNITQLTVSFDPSHGTAQVRT